MGHPQRPPHPRPPRPPFDDFGDIPGEDSDDDDGGDIPGDGDVPGDEVEVDDNSDDGYDGDINTTLREKTVIEDESHTFNRLNDGGFLTTPELSSFEASAGTHPITMENLDDSMEGYKTAGSHEEEPQIPNPVMVRLENEHSGPSLVSPITGGLPPLRDRLLEMSTSTPLMDSSEVAASRTLIWNDGHVKEVGISQSGARIPLRRSNRVQNHPKQYPK